MTGKLLGAILIIAGCGGFGVSMTASFKREEAALCQLIGILDYIQCELQYRLTPLPDLCRQVSVERRNQIGKFFRVFGEELESCQIPDVESYMRIALSKFDSLPRKTVTALELLGNTMGRFDLEGQIQSLESVRQYCRQELDTMGTNRDIRLRSYQTLGLCTGAALAILFV